MPCGKWVYLGSDDMEDYYRSGKLREQAVK